MAIRAVLTGDIVNSTRLTKNAERKLLYRLRILLSPYKSEFYRGDSFQVYLKDPEPALRLALLCRAVALSIHSNSISSKADNRISIGIGEAQTPRIHLGSGKGAAFILSGRAFDAMQKTETRLSIAIEHPIAAIALEVMADTLNDIYHEMTAKQASLVFEMLQGKTQKQVARLLKKSKSTISQMVASAKFTSIEKILTQYEQLLKQLV